jgi:hypothetical protein
MVNREPLYALESAHLARADEQIRRGMEIIVRLRELVEGLKTRGRPHEQAQRALEAMTHAQDLMGRHRSMIVGTLAWLANHDHGEDGL